MKERNRRIKELMKMDMDSIKIEELEGEQLEIAECVGIDGYRKLVNHFGGTSVYIQKSDTLCINSRNKKIFESFNGYNYKVLARKFNLSEGQIRKIIALSYRSEL